jgi:hypothetical protein
MSLASNQYTIVDYNDAVTLSGIISPNLARMQIYTPDNTTMVPDWTVGAGLVLTPSLFKAGGADDIIGLINTGSVKWTEIRDGVATVISSGTGSYTIAGSVLTCKANKLLNPYNAVDYLFECTYTDPTTALILPWKQTISFAKVSSGGGVMAALAYATGADVFKKVGGSVLPASIELMCQLWKGSTLDSTCSYQWYVADITVGVSTLSVAAGPSDLVLTLSDVSWCSPTQQILIGAASPETKTIQSVNTANKTITINASITNAANRALNSPVKSTTYDIDLGGGWRNLGAVNSTGYYSNPQASKLTVFPDLVTNIGIFRCKIIDTETNGKYYDSVTVTDSTDPYYVEITSTAGDTFKNSLGSTTLSAEFKQGGVNADPTGTKTYTWTLRDQNGAQQQWKTGDGIAKGLTKTGKTVTVDSYDITVKGVVTCDVT